MIRPSATRTLNERLEKDPDIVTSSQVSMRQSDLAGRRVDFSHSNMLPFYGSSVKQPTDASAWSSTLERHTGIVPHHKNKHETRPVEPPKHNAGGHVAGTPVLKDDTRVRMIPENRKKAQGVRPFEQYREAPGLGLSADQTIPSVESTLQEQEYTKNRTVDELRTLNNPKITYASRPLGPPLRHFKRGVQSAVARNRPENLHDATPIRAGPAVTSQASQRPNVIDRATTRQETTSYQQGVAAPAVGTETSVRSKFQVSQRPEFDSFTEGYRNIGQSAVTQMPSGTYQSQPTTRESYEKNSTAGYLKSVMTMFTAPVIDAIRSTRKETTLSEQRVGDFSTSVAPKAPVYDPNDIPRTTVKETTLSEQRVGDFSTSVTPKAPVYDPNDVLRTTVKETTLSEQRAGDFSTSVAPKAPVYDPNDVLRTTVKETTLREQRAGDFSTSVALKAPVYDPNDVLRTTMKETTLHSTEFRPAAITDKNASARITKFQVPMTHKETLSNKEHVGLAEGKNRTGAYTTSTFEVKPTHKQATSNVEYQGTAGGDLAPQSYNAVLAATTNAVKERISQGRTPGGNNFKVSTGPDTYAPIASNKMGVRENVVHTGVGSAYGGVGPQRIPVIQETTRSQETPVDFSVASTQLAQNDLAQTPLHETTSKYTSFS